MKIAHAFCEQICQVYWYTRYSNLLGGVIVLTQLWKFMMHVHIEHGPNTSQI